MTTKTAYNHTFNVNYQFVLFEQNTTVKDCNLIVDNHIFQGNELKIKNVVDMFKDYYKDFNIDKMNNLLTNMHLSMESTIKTLSGLISLCNIPLV